MCCFMLSSRTIRRVSCLSLWSKLEIALSRNDHFFGNGLSSSSFLFPPNVKHDVLDISVLSVLSLVYLRSTTLLNYLYSLWLYLPTMILLYIILSCSLAMYLHTSPIICVLFASHFGCIYLLYCM
jgi:hypothetical protein